MKCLHAVFIFDGYLAGYRILCWKKDVFFFFVYFESIVSVCIGLLHCCLSSLLLALK